MMDLNQEILSSNGQSLAYVSEKNDSVTIDKREFGESCYKLAKNLYDKSDLNLAESYFYRALACTELPRDIYTVLKIHGFLIRIASEKMEDNKARELIKSTEKLVEDLTQNLGSLNSEYFYNVGIVKNYRGDFQGSGDNFKLAVRKAKEENEPEILAKSLLALANNNMNVGQLDEALDHLHQLNQLLKIIQKNYLLGSLNFFSGKIYSELAQNDQSLHYFTLASQTLQDKKCWNLQGYILLSKGIVYKQRGEYEKALMMFELAKENIDHNTMKRLSRLIAQEVDDVNDSSVDIYLDKTNRKIHEKHIGIIDFKHRFVLLEILFLLANNPGKYFDKDHLAKLIWMDEYNPLIHDKLIYTSVSRLRKLIEPKNEKNTRRKYIIRGKDGYTFNPDVKIRFQMEKRSKVAGPIGNVEISSPV